MTALVVVIGCTGTEGSQGTQGSAGQTGASGQPGAIGTPGSPGGQGPAGEAGAAGMQGPPGPFSDGGGPSLGSLGGVVWKDRNGNPVRLVFQIESGSGDWYVMDANGLVWATNFYDGVPRPFVTGYGLIYASANCSGPAYVSTRLHSRFVFTSPGDPTLRVVPDAPTTMVTGFTVGSSFGGGGCAVQTWTTDAVALSETAPATPIVAAATLFALPVHPAAL
jgi:hypothetical protein